MVATYLMRLPALSLVPRVSDFTRVRVGLVPRDYVIDAMDVLSVMERSEGRTYALTDPDAPTAEEVLRTMAHHLGRRAIEVPLPLGPTKAIIDRVPGLESLTGMTAELLDYFATPTTYSTKNAVADLEGTGVSCPAFASYAERLLDYMVAHPEHDASAMT